MSIIIINFAHPLTEEHIQQIEYLIGQEVEKTIDVPTQFDLQQPMAPQVVELVDACGLTPKEWQSLPLLVNPPALSSIAITLIAELHGRMGHFPTCIRMRPVPGAMPPRYEVAEILDLQSLREEARGRRGITVAPGTSRA